MVKVKAKSPRKGERKTASCKEPSQCPHEHFRHDVPDRRGIARDKHINILATPRGYHWEDVKKESGDEEKPSRKTATPRRRCPDKYGKKPEKSDAEEFISKQRESNIVNSSTVSLYKKPRDIGDGKVVLDSVIKMRTPNKMYCDKFPKSNIGIRNTWIKDFSDLISGKMADYVLDTMCAERTERQQEIAQNLLNRFNTLLEQKASLANPKTQTHKTMVLVADRLSLWLDKNVPMSKENAQRLKDIEEAHERKKSEDERRKQIKEERKRAAEKAGEKPGEERPPGEGDQRGEGDEGSEGPPEAPGAQPGEPGAEPGEPGAQPEEGGAQPGEAGAQPEEAGAQPGEPGDKPEEAGAQPEEAEAQPGEPGAQPEEAGAPTKEHEAEPDEPGTQTGEAEVQPGQPEAAPGVSEDGETKPATEGEPPAGEEGAQSVDDTKTFSPENEPDKEATDPLKDKEDEGQETPAPAAEEATPAEPGEEEPQPDVPTPTKSEPESSDTALPEKDDGTQPGASGQETPQEEPKGDDDKDLGPTAAQPEPPPSGDEVQLTPSESQEKADAEDVTLPSDADQKITSDEEPLTDIPGETPEAAAEQETVPSAGEEITPVEGEETPSEVGDEKAGELPGEVASTKEGVPADQIPDEPIVGDDGQPTTRPGEPSSSGGAKQIAPEQSRQKEIIETVASKLLETPIEETPRQEAIKDVVGKQLESELGDEEKAAIDQVASKVGTWIDKLVEQVENEYGDRDRRVPSETGRGRSAPVSQKPKGSIFLVKKVDDRKGYDVDLISNTRALEKIRMARGKSPARAEVMNPNTALEPTDLKNWARWASAVTDMAQSWAQWIEDTVQEAQKKGELLQTDDSPERLKEWDEFRDKKSHSAQKWRKTKKEVDLAANMWTQKGMKTRELNQPQTK